MFRISFFCTLFLVNNMQTQIVFDFLSAQNLLVPFLKQDKVLQDLGKDELLVLVEKLLDPPVVEQQVAEVIEPENTSATQKFTVDLNYRQNTIKMTIQDVLNTLVKDGVIPVGGMSKRDLNDTACKLGLIEYMYSCGRKLWQPSEKGESIGIKPKTHYAVYYSLQAYEEIKAHLLSNA